VIPLVAVAVVAVVAIFYFGRSATRSDSTREVAPRAAESSGPGIPGWPFPFVWILLSPLVTFPLQVSAVRALYESDACTYSNPGGEMFAGNWECPTDEMFSTLWPGVLNVVAFAWAFAPGRTRSAAITAGILGGVRWIVPGVMYQSASTVDVDWAIAGPFDTFHASATAVSAALWFLSLIAAVVFAAVVRARDSG